MHDALMKHSLLMPHPVMRLPCLVIFTKQYLQTDVFATSSYSLRQLIVLIFFTTYKDKLKYKVILVLKH